jgi:hypothetical protein
MREVIADERTSRVSSPWSRSTSTSPAVRSQLCAKHAVTEVRRFNDAQLKRDEWLTIQEHLKRVPAWNVESDHAEVEARKSVDAFEIRRKLLPTRQL